MTSAFAAPQPPGDSPQDVSLPESGWNLHVGRGPRLQPALEVHTLKGLIDIAVAGGRDAPMVRGALRGRHMARRWALAWGHLPPEPHQVIVEFRGRRGSQLVAATPVANAFWVAEAPGAFRSIVVAAGPALPAMRLTLHRYRR